ncbi:MAG: hypothetical protein D6807_00245, partial [Alphaproteobacteria bacterium]
LYLPAALAAALVLWAPVERKPHPVGLALAIAYLIGFLLVRPLPVFPPIGAIGWLPYALVVGLATGLLADRPRTRLIATIAFVLLLPPLITLAVGSETYMPFLQGPGWLNHLILAAGGILVFARLAERGSDPAAPRMLFFASAGLAVLAALYGGRIALHAMGLVVVILGAGLAAWKSHLPWPRSASHAAGALYFALLVTLVFTREPLAFPAGLTLLPFFTPRLAERLVPKGGAHALALEIALSLAAVGAAIWVYYHGV